MYNKQCIKATQPVVNSYSSPGGLRHVNVTNIFLSTDCVPGPTESVAARSLLNLPNARQWKNFPISGMKMLSFQTRPEDAVTSATSKRSPLTLQCQVPDALRVPSPGAPHPTL